MRGVGARPRAFMAASIAMVLCGASGPALAQAQQKPAPPQPETTTVAEPRLPAPHAPESDRQGPAHVPPDASGINLSELDTDDVELLYSDPAQTYLTPHTGRAFTNSLRFHEDKSHWK